MKAPTKEEYEKAKTLSSRYEIAIDEISNQIRKLSWYHSILTSGNELCKRIIDLYESNGAVGGGDKNEQLL